MAVPFLLEFMKWVHKSVLVVWKVGASWVFLDSSHPIQRLQSQSDRVKAPLVLTQRHLHEVLLPLERQLEMIEDDFGEEEDPCSCDVVVLPLFW